MASLKKKMIAGCLNIFLLAINYSSLGTHLNCDQNTIYSLDTAVKKRSMTHVELSKRYHLAGDQMKYFFIIFFLHISVKADKNFNLRFDPIHTVSGYLNLTGEYAVLDNWTVGPTFLYAPALSILLYADKTSNAYDYTVFAAGVKATWYWDYKYSTGAYISPSVKYLNASATTQPGNSAQNIKGSNNYLLLGVVAGYAWFCEHFNQMLGLSISQPLGESKLTMVDKVTGSDADILQLKGYSTGFPLAFEYTIGWSF